VLRRPVESALGASIGVEHNRGRQLPTQGDRHLEGIFDEVGAHVVAHRPSDHTTGVGIDHGGQVQPPFPGAQVGDVTNPHRIEDAGVPGPFRCVGRVGVPAVALGRGAPPPRANPAQAELAHRLRDRLAADGLAVLAQVGKNSCGAGDTSNGPTEAINGRLEHLRGSALGFRNLINYIARSLLETGGSRPQLHPGL
jgi:hypothetical protein